jgi:hypothetical protein
MRASAIRAASSAWAQGWPKIAAEQKFMQTAPGFVHQKTKDALVYKYIPLGMSLGATVLLVPGLFSMYLGINKTE